MQFQSTILIDDNVNRVFQYTVDPRNLKRWVRGFRQYKPQQGRNRNTGSTAVQVFEDDGQVTEVREEVLSKINNKELSLRLSHKNMETRVRYLFLNQGNTTKVLVNTNVRLKPFFFNLFSFFVKGPMKRQQKADLQKLKAVIEGEQ